MLARMTFSLLRNDAKLTSFYGREVNAKQGAFDDSAQLGTKFWGGYASNIIKLWPGTWVDAYYLGIDRNRGLYGTSAAKEEHHSIGGRLLGSIDPFRYAYEGVYQFGKFGALDIKAWGLLAVHHYMIPELPFSPILGLITNFASGDTNSKDRTLGTFDALFPNNSYIAIAAPLRRRNLIELHPTVSLGSPKSIKFSFWENLLCRLQNSDAVYAPSGFPLTADPASNNLFIGTILDVGASWRLNSHITISGTYNHG